MMLQLWRVLDPLARYLWWCLVALKASAGTDPSKCPSTAPWKPMEDCERAPSMKSNNLYTQVTYFDAASFDQWDFGVGGDPYNDLSSYAAHEDLVKVFNESWQVHISQDRMQNLYRFVGGYVVGGWGGECTCPNGEKYWVGDNYDSCQSLACKGNGAKSGSTCSEANPRPGWLVTCGVSAFRTVRLESKPVYKGGFFIFDIEHIPDACGVTPVIRLDMGGHVEDGIDLLRWPNGRGEVRAGLRSRATVSKGRCVMECHFQDLFSNTYGTVSDGSYGTMPRLQCDRGSGCFVAAKDAFSAISITAAELNAQGGGILAVEWEPERFVKIWFWRRTEEPSDILVTERLKSEKLGKPHAFFGFGPSCTPAHFDKPLRIVVDMELCADDTLFSRDCPQEHHAHGSCVSMARAAGFSSGAVWAFRSMRVMQQPKAGPVTCYREGFDYGNAGSGSCAYGELKGVVGLGMEWLNWQSWWPSTAVLEYRNLGSFEGCKRRCGEVPGCDFASWEVRENDGVCWMKASLSCAGVQYAPRPGWISGPKYCEPPVDCFADGGIDEYQNQEGHACGVGGVVATSIDVIKTSRDCQLECQLNADCNFFTFAEAEGALECQLKSERPCDGEGAGMRQGVVTGPKHCVVDVFCWEDDLDYGNYSAGACAESTVLQLVSQTSAGMCHKICAADQNCFAFTFIRSNHMCVLKDQILCTPAYGKHAGASSGTVSCLPEVFEYPNVTCTHPRDVLDPYKWQAWAGEVWLGDPPGNDWNQKNHREAYVKKGFANDGPIGYRYGTHTLADRFTLGNGQELVEVWFPYHPNDHATAVLLQALLEFMRGHELNRTLSLVRIKRTGENGASDEKKRLICSRGHSCPNLVIISSRSLAKFYFTGNTVNLNEFFANHLLLEGVRLQDSFPKAYTYNLLINGEWVAAPLRVELRFLVINRTRLRLLGVPEPPPHGKMSQSEWTWEKFVDVACLLKDRFGAPGFKFVAQTVSSSADEDSLLMECVFLSANARLFKQSSDSSRYVCGLKSNLFGSHLAASIGRGLREKCIAYDDGRPVWERVEDATTSPLKDTLAPLNLSALPDPSKHDMKRNWRRTISDNMFWYSRVPEGFDEEDTIFTDLPGAFTPLMGEVMFISKPSEKPQSNTEHVEETRRQKLGFEIMLKFLDVQKSPHLSNLALSFNTIPPNDILLQQFPWTDKTWEPLRRSMRRAVPPQYPEIAPIPYMGAINEMKPLRLILMRYVYKPDYDAHQAIEDGCAVIDEALRPCDPRNWNVDLKCLGGCQVGEYFIPGPVFQCQPCPPGAAQANETIRLACDPCDPGTYQDVVGSSQCKACTPGKSTSIAGTTKCIDCSEGKYSSTNASSMCIPCDVGTYQSSSRATSCKPCRIRGLVSTLHDISKETEAPNWIPIEGSAEATVCRCKVGARFVDDECVPCVTEGLDCQGGGGVEGGGIIFVKEGFSSGVELSVFHCFGDVLRCPGGPPGESCAKGRRGISCARCEDGMTPTDNGECVACEDRDVVPFVVVVDVVIAFLIVTYLLITRYNPAKRYPILLLFGIILGQFVTMIQQLTVLSSMNLIIRDPLKEFFRLVSLFALDLDILRLSCVITRIDELVQFIAKASIIYWGFIFLACLHGVHVVVYLRCRFKEHRYAFIASAGTFAMVFYIIVIITVLSPFQCASHPNGLWTMRSLQSVVCWGNGAASNHQSMIILSLAFMLAPLGFLAYCVRVVYIFPTRMRYGDTKFLKEVGFLFSRCNPEKYWFVLVVIFRSLMVGLLPIIPNPMLQLNAMQLLLTMYFGIISSCSPWRIPTANATDSGFTVVTLMIVNACAFFAASSDYAALGWACISLVVIALACAITMFLCSCQREISFRRRKPFDFFLCHHKAGAGCFARLLQVCFQEIGHSAFIDCDDLQNLDKLFDYVGSESDVLVVLSSKEVLLRPWCIGELVTARLNQVKTVKLILTDFEEPDAKFIETYDELVPTYNKLAPYGIGLKSIQDALQWLADRPHVHIPSTLTQQSVEGLIKSVRAVNYTDVAKGRQSCPDPKLRRSRAVLGVPSLSSCGPVAVTADNASQTIVLADPSDFETQACAVTIVKLLFPLLAHQPNLAPRLLPPGQELPSCTQLVLILCTNNGFRQRHFLQNLMAAGRQECMHIPVLADESFRFPTEGFVKESCAAADIIDDHRAILGIIRDIFKIIAVVFQPSAYSSTEKVLVAQASQIVARILNTKMLARLTVHRSITEPSLNDQMSVISALSPSPVPFSKIHTDRTSRPALQIPIPRTKTEEYSQVSSPVGSKSVSAHGKQNDLTLSYLDNGPECDNDYDVLTFI